MEISKKPRYNLNIVVQESGIKADTIRAWERRYGLPSPGRTEGGHRLYSEYDLEILKWLAARQKEGLRISHAVDYWKELIASGEDPLRSLSDSGAFILSSQVQGVDEAPRQLRELWLESCFSFDETSAEQILSQTFAQYPALTVCTDLILPALQRVGELWQKGEISVQQEHFTTEIATRKLQALISAAPNPVYNQKILLGNPPGEQHTIGLLVMALLLKNRGWPIIYLGGNVPVDDLLDTVKNSNVDLAIMSASRLVTSASLLDAARVLAENGTPVAFSGWVFSQSPEIHALMPGIYLGDDLAAAVNLVEAFLNDPHPVDRTEFKNSEHQSLIQNLQAIIPDLNRYILDKMAARDIRFRADEILAANRDLIADLTAALKIGDPAQLLLNLAWVSDLLAFRNKSDINYQAYIVLFAEGLADILGEEAAPILPIFDHLFPTDNKD